MNRENPTAERPIQVLIFRSTGRDELSRASYYFPFQRLVGRQSVFRCYS